MPVLMTITGNKALEQNAAKSYFRALAGGLPHGVTSAYRSWAKQQELRNAYLAGTGNYALPPGESNHVKGTALDLPGDVKDTKTPRGWMKKYGRAYGFYPVSNEEWHFDYDKDKDENMSDTPNRNWFGRSTDQGLAAGKWTTVKLNEKGDISVAIGTEAVTANVWVQVSGLPVGKQIQGRFYIVDTKTGKTVRATTLQRTLTEFIGTEGTTFLRFGAITGLTNTQRLRSEVWVESDVKNAKIVNAGADALTWN